MKRRNNDVQKIRKTLKIPYYREFDTEYTELEELPENSKVANKLEKADSDTETKVKEV